MEKPNIGLLSDEFRFPYVLQYEQYKLSRDITARFSAPPISGLATGMN